MAKEATIKTELFASGYCEAHEKVVNPQKGLKKLRFYAVWALIHVPDLGYIMFDTGYSNHFDSATKYFPEILYKFATPVQLKDDEKAIEILRKKGIHHTEIKYIIISHFHADHIAGLKDFPNAKLVCTKEAFQQTQNLKGISAVSKGVIHKLIPNDIKERIVFIEDISSQTKNEFGITEYTWTQIPNFKLLHLPGHAKGMLGFYDKGSNLLFATDAAWDEDCFNKGIMPLQVVRIFIDSWFDLKDTIEKLSRLKHAHPDMKIVFTHCPKTLQLISNEI
jgi:glyoxylase-like metal-dependent hydrolase (beta-lactamase superfamily II)